jgi:hypothetical protein
MRGAVAEEVAAEVLVEMPFRTSPKRSRLKPRLGPAAEAALRPFTGRGRAALKDSLTVASSLATHRAVPPGVKDGASALPAR